MLGAESIEAAYSRMTKADLLKFIDATAGAFLCWAMRPFYVQKAVPPAVNNPERILVIRPGGMGDMILLFPVLRALRRNHPDATIDLICETRNLEIVALCGVGLTTLPYDSSPFKVLAALRRNTYSMVIDSEQFHHFSAILTAFSQAPVRIGFSINPRRNIFYTHLVPYSLTGYEGDEFLKLLEASGVSATSEDETALCPATSGTTFPAAPEGGKRIVLCPGSLSRYKRWPVASYVSVAKHLIHKGHSIILVGGKNDRAEAAEVMHLINRPEIHNLTGALNIKEVAELFSESALFVGGDSGLAHLAAAVGIPRVSLFGSTDDRKWARADDHSHVVRRPVACSPCAMFGYYKSCQTIECMSGISVDDVSSACEAALA